MVRRAMADTLADPASDDPIEALLAPVLELPEAEQERAVAQLCDRHAELVSALRARDPDRAEQAMRTHLEKARASTLDRMLPVTR